jgi:hypothetical protein
MTRLDHNRAISQLAAKLGVPVNDVKKMTIWGNHSNTQYPDLFHAEVDGKNAYEAVGDHEWYDQHVHPHRRQARRGDHQGPRRVVGRLGGERRGRPHPVVGARHPEGDWVSMAVPSPTAATACPRDHLELPVRLQGRRVVDRAGPRHRRLQPRQDRRHRRRARRPSATP